jgi:hypothetical protein
MKNIFKLLAVVTIFFFASCSDILDLDGNLENPNEVGTANLDADLLNNKVQLDFALFAERVNNPAMDLSRMTARICSCISATRF